MKNSKQNLKKAVFTKKEKKILREITKFMWDKQIKKIEISKLGFNGIGKLKLFHKND